MDYQMPSQPNPTNQPPTPRSHGGLIASIIALIIIITAVLTWYLYYRPAYPSETGTYSETESMNTSGDTTADIQSSLDQAPADSAAVESSSSLDADVNGF